MSPSTFKPPDLLLPPPPANPGLSRRLEGIALILIAVSAILFQQSVTRPWAEGRGSAGNRLAVSPIGLADYGPGTSGTAPVECRWWPKVGNETLCEIAPGGEAAMTRLRRAYPLAVVSLWTSILALFLVALRIPRSATSLGVIATAAVPVLAVSALWSLASSLGGALSVLQQANLHVAQRGFGSMFGGALLGAVAVGLLVVSRMKAAPTPVFPLQ
jgi:hypothetical protein